MPGLILHELQQCGFVCIECVCLTGLTVMDRPPLSSELNIIEAVWDHLDRERNKTNSREELLEVLNES